MAVFPAVIEDVQVTKTLGRGFFGEVCRAQEKEGLKRTFAIKKVKRSLIAEHNFDEQIQREMTIMYSLDHPRIVKLFFNFEDAKCLYLGMEFASGGCLYDKLSRAKRFSTEVASRYFAETCDALDYLHHLPEKVIHRDLKPENILLDADDHVKLADFGWANLLQGNVRDTFCGTLDYLAPEMIQGTGHNESVDMWSMGVLLFELITGNSPFAAGSKEATCRAIIDLRLHYPSGMDADAQDLVSRLCRTLPSERLAAREALAHALVASRRRAQVQAEAAPAAEKAQAESACGEFQDPALAVALQLRAEREKTKAEMQRLLQAKQQTEDSWLQVNSEIDETHRKVQRERQQRVKTEAACAELKKTIAAQELELQRERKLLASGEQYKASERTLRASTIFRSLPRGSKA